MGNHPSQPAPAAAGLALDDRARLQLDACVHCGFCLPACPTYKVLGEEPDSPRGRIYLIQAAHEGRLDPEAPDFLAHLDLCLDCRACESACPSGVRYGALVESARATLFRRTGGGRTPLARAAWTVLFRGVWGSPRRLARVARLTAWAQRRGLLRGRLARRLPGPLGAMAPVLPLLEGRPSRDSLPERVPARGSGGRGRAVAFLGCVQDAFFPADNRAMVGVLAALGYQVDVPREQVCCGALHLHAGDEEGARDLARRNVAALAGTEGPVVVNAAGCGAMMKEYGHLLPGDEEARRLADRVRDLSEVVAGVPPAERPPARPLGVRVTYHDPCHLAHGQGVRRQPRELLRSLPGVEYVELEEADTCCGSAGIYNFLQFDMAMELLRRKTGHVRETGARWLVTANPGCALQLRLGVAQAGLDVEVKTLGEVLAEAYGVGGDGDGAAG